MRKAARRGTADGGYFQTTNFTCGPSALMTGIAALVPSYVPEPAEELSIWREANIIFTARPPAGCGPYGLARAALKRGVAVEVFEDDAADIFVPLAATEEDARSQKLMATIDREEAVRAGAVVTPFRLSAEFIRAQLAAGRQLMALTSQDPDGHWVVVREIAANDDVTIFDPYKAKGEELENPWLTDKGRNVFSFEAFAQMTQYGPLRGRIILALSRP